MINIYLDPKEEDTKDDICSICHDKFDNDKYIIVYRKSGFMRNFPYNTQCERVIIPCTCFVSLYSKVPMYLGSLIHQNRLYSVLMENRNVNTI